MHNLKAVTVINLIQIGLETCDILQKGVFSEHSVHFILLQRIYSHREFLYLFYCYGPPLSRPVINCSSSVCLSVCLYIAWPWF